MCGPLGEIFMPRSKLPMSEIRDFILNLWLAETMRPYMIIFTLRHCLRAISYETIIINIINLTPKGVIGQIQNDKGKGLSFWLVHTCFCGLQGFTLMQLVPTTLPDLWFNMLQPHWPSTYCLVISLPMTFMLTLYSAGHDLPSGLHLSESFSHTQLREAFHDYHLKFLLLIPCSHLLLPHHCPWHHYWFSSKHLLLSECIYFCVDLVIVLLQ